MKPNSIFNDLPQYHFERDAFTKTFYEEFNQEQIDEIYDSCSGHLHVGEFFLTYDSDEYYIMHKPSGIMINWYKHLGRTNTCNMKTFTLDNLKEFLRLLHQEFNDSHIKSWDEISVHKDLKEKVIKKVTGPDIISMYPDICNCVDDHTITNKQYMININKTYFDCECGYGTFTSYYPYDKIPNGEYLFKFSCRICGKKIATIPAKDSNEAVELFAKFKEKYYAERRYKGE